jgi:Xaa-Pro aminopeptidase
VIDEAGYGEWYRHRTGHCIGLDTHERPFLSIEDQTVLEPGMAFTIEPSIFWPGNVGVRVEDLLVLEEHGCRNLNDFHHDLIATAA